ncbi:YihY/virulence factor BrkB family protein [Crocosphaera sp. UHCC 0190]|uniref:YihY/virulence factor BrkB family protein n=1 Tax=Crocosphaera sp. UHCC 0190 TaxID=3110246 RepID=UPI002B215A95|nr:YihY/virulence factor BrkB family protein [Crocosphaera sp. UHCC 0190]MEA5511555.1 YihY/virulence factor BrkB family protein [Crocosphaera sp. UHCC 0190]
MIEFVQTRLLSSKIVQLFTRTIIKWQRDECLEMGAALSYYAIFSLFPILLVILSITGLILGPYTSAYSQILTFAKGALPLEAYKIVESTLVHLNESSLGAGLIGFAILFITASRIFNALNRAVDKIWKVHENRIIRDGWIWQVIDFIKNQIVAFLLVLSTTALILISLLSNIALKIILKLLKDVEQMVSWFKVDEALLWNTLQVGVTFLLLTLVVMVLFKTLPSPRVKWGDIWLGALITVSLFSLLQGLVGSGVIRIGEQFQAYGVIGGFMVLLFWIYIICQIFFLGCEFTYVYTHLFGSRRHK